MFYSHTFLAKKGPLGTVWCAAHLQHRLKKTHYNSINIIDTVECIMFPDVPMALRLSGHLLLGVVRIYSKKVDFLYHDCNVVRDGLGKAFATAEVNLPENARTAKFESVTLPQTFDLDALDLDFDTQPEGSPDHHTRSQEEITLEDQIPIDRDPYVVITFDEDFLTDTVPSEHGTDAEVRPMDEDILPPSGIDNGMDVPIPSHADQMENPSGTVDLPSTQKTVPMDDVETQELGPTSQTETQNITSDFPDPGPSQQTEAIGGMPRDENLPLEIEVMRHATDFSCEDVPSVFSDDQHAFYPTRDLDQVPIEKENPSLFNEDVLLSGGLSSPFQRRSEPTNDVPGEASEKLSDFLFRHESPDLVLRSTPPVEPPKPRPRVRKRKQFFDEATVLTNKFMKKTLENSGDILRKRKEIPSTKLGVWKLNNNLRKEQVFHEPSLTGYCANISNLFMRDYITSKPHLTLEREATPEPCVATPCVASTEANTETMDANLPSHPTEAASERETGVIPEPPVVRSPTSETERVAEIEHLRHQEGQDGDHLLPDSPSRLMASPARFVSSPLRTDDFTPTTLKNLGSESLAWAQTSIETEVLPTPDIPTSVGTYTTCTTEPETSRTFFSSQFDAGHTGLSDVPESIAELEDLHFLEADNTPVGSQGSQTIGSLSVRSRAVAQYLQRRTPITLESGERSGDLSLNMILQGKTKKLCARMFFETLVLKTCDLIDVQQEQPYGDITLKLTSNLSKAQI